ILIVVTGLALPARAQIRVCEQTYGNSAGTTFRSYIGHTSRAGNGIIAAGLKRNKTTNQPKRYLLRLGPSCDTIWTRVPSANLNVVGDAITALDSNYLFVGVEEAFG